MEEQTDEEGNTVEMTDEEKTAALETAKADALATAQAIQSRLTNGEDAQALADEYADALYSSSIHTTAMGSTFSSAAYADWLYDAARQSGDITLAELDRSESSAYNYYVVQFDSRTRDDSATADVRHILIGAASSGTTPTQEEFDAAEAEAQALLDQWKAGDATEDSFAAMAVQNTPNSPNVGMTTNNPMRQNTIPAAIPMADWPFPGFTLIFFDISKRSSFQLIQKHFRRFHFPSPAAPAAVSTFSIPY